MPTIATDIIALDDAKAYLRSNTPADDALLKTFISSASQMIANRIGQVAGAPSLDEWYDGGVDRIALRSQPVQSVTSVTESYGTISYALTEVTLDSGSVATAYSYTVDLDAGVLVRRASGVATPFAAGTRNIHVVYVGGFPTVPADLQLACGLMVKHLWETQRGPGRPALGGGAESPGGVSGYLWPHRVEEILSAYDMPGIA